MTRSADLKPRIQTGTVNRIGRHAGGMEMVLRHVTIGELAAIYAKAARSALPEGAQDLRIVKRMLLMKRSLTVARREKHVGRPLRMIHPALHVEGAFRD